MVVEPSGAERRRPDSHRVNQPGAVTHASCRLAAPGHSSAAPEREPVRAWVRGVRGGGEHWSYSTDQSQSQRFPPGTL